MSERNKKWEEDVKGIVEIVKMDAPKKEEKKKEADETVKSEQTIINLEKELQENTPDVSIQEESAKVETEEKKDVSENAEKVEKEVEESSSAQNENKETEEKNETESETSTEEKIQQEDESKITNPKNEEGQDSETTLSLEDALREEGIKLYDEMDPVKQTKLEILSEEVKDRHSIIFFGAKAQESLNRVSESILEKVKSKDLGYAGEDLNNLVQILKDFDIEELDPTQKQGFFSKLLGMASPVQKFLSKYDDVRVQIDNIVDDLEQKKSRLLVDITALEKLYRANYEFIKNLDEYIAAGAYKVKLLDEELKKLEEEAKGSKKLEKKLGVRDLRALKTALEARVHDMKLSRVVALQSLPSIRLIQDNNKTLVEKINSTLVNTLPLWKNQLAQAVTIFRSKKASESIKAAQDFTNELLEKNAEKLKEATKEITEQANRGVFDIESIKKANKTLISSINESLQITEKAKDARAKAEEELIKIEKELQDALVAAEKRKIKV